MSRRKFWSPKLVLLKNPHMDLFRLTPSELQHRGSILKGTNGRQGGTKVSDIRARDDKGANFCQTEWQAEAIVPFLNPYPTEPQSWRAGAISETPST